MIQAAAVGFAVGLGAGAVIVFLVVLGWAALSVNRTA